MGISVDPNTIIHFSTLTYDFNPSHDENENWDLYQKLIDNLNPEWQKNRWAFPKINKRITLKMSQKGRLTIPLKRGFPIKHLLQELYKGLNFLSPEEYLRLITLFYLRDTERNDANPYFHLANAVTDDNKGETVKEKLDKANIILRFVNHLGIREVEVEVDQSMGYYEIEEKGRSPQSVNLNKIFATPQILTGSIADIDDKVTESRRNTYDLKQGQTILHNGLVKQGDTTQLLQLDLDKYHEDEIAYISEVDARLFNFRLSSEINEVDVRNQFLSVKQHLKKILSGIDNHDKFMREDLRNSIVLIDKEFQELKPYIGEKLFDNTEDIINGISSFITDHKKDNNEGFKKIESRLDKLNLDLQEGFKDLKKNLKSIIENEFQDFGKRFKNNLEVVIRQLHHLPSITAKELSKKMNKSRSMVYNYLKELQDRNLVNGNYSKSNKKGRPSKIYTISKKTRNLIKKKEI